MLLELHCHSAEHSSCSRIAAAELARQCVARNLQGMVLTDHHYRWDDEELAALRRAAGVPLQFLLLAGQEVATGDCGHVLVFGDVPSLPEGLRVPEIRARFPEAALVRAHPYRHRLEHGADPLAGPLCDAVEILSANHSVNGNLRGLEDWHRLRFTATAGTDAHGQVAAGTYPTQFDHPVADAGELAREIRRGRCRPLIKEISLAGASSRVTQIVIGTKGTGHERPRIVLRRSPAAQDWPRTQRTADLMREIASRGFASGRFRLPGAVETDADRRTVVEEGLRGRTLHDRMADAGPEEARAYLRLAAQWLARLHRLDPPPAGGADFLGEERRRLGRYAERFRDAGHPRAALVRELCDALLRETTRLAAPAPGRHALCHGDYHPKNVIIGQDNPEDRNTLFVAAVDFEKAGLAPRAFDVGWFIAHYRHQLGGRPALLESCPPEAFVSDYREESAGLAPDFEREVALFIARGELSIAAYLMKLGLGGRPEVGRLLAEAWGAAGHGGFLPVSPRASRPGIGV